MGSKRYSRVVGVFASGGISERKGWLLMKALRSVKGPVRFLFPLVLLLLVPTVVSNGYVLFVLSLGWVYSILALGVVVSYGYAGIPNMSQGTLFGVGAYVGGDLMIHLGMSFLLSAVIAACCTALVGGVLGSTALRVKGNYWWLITIAFTQIMFLVFNSWTAFTGGENGLIGVPIATIGSTRISSDTGFYYLGLIALAIIFLLYSRFVHSRIGLAVRAVRADETAARGLGLSPGAMKVVAMALAGFGAGLAGICLVAITGYVSAQSFNMSFSFEVMLFAVVGGLTNLWGAVIASVALTFVTTEVTSLVNQQLFIFGGVVLVTLFLRLYLGGRTSRSPRPITGTASTSAQGTSVSANGMIREET
jgi:branched-chain amino acid transport system permease protein